MFSHLNKFKCRFIKISIKGQLVTEAITWRCSVVLLIGSFCVVIVYLHLSQQDNVLIMYAKQPVKLPELKLSGRKEWIPQRSFLTSYMQHDTHPSLYTEKNT